MKEQGKPSPLYQWLVIVFFGVFTIAALIVLLINGYQLLGDILIGSAIVSFNKGAMYMFGVGGGAGYLTYAFAKEATGCPLRSETSRKATFWSIGMIALVFALPQAAHFGVGRYAAAMDYMYCSQASSQWLHARTVVYAADGQSCETYASTRETRN